MTVASGEINLQSKHTLAKSAHSMADVFSVFIIPFCEIQRFDKTKRNKKLKTTYNRAILNVFLALQWERSAHSNVVFFFVKRNIVNIFPVFLLLLTNAYKENLFFTSSYDRILKKIYQNTAFAFR